MADSIRRANGSAQRLLSDMRPAMVKADIRIPESADGAGPLGEQVIRKTDVSDSARPESGSDDWRLRIGRALERVKGSKSLKEFADLIQRDERQVKRWIDGAERPHLDAIFAVESLRGALVIALAELAKDIEVITEIRVRTRRVAS